MQDAVVQHSPTQATKHGKVGIGFDFPSDAAIVLIASTLIIRTYDIYIVVSSLSLIASSFMVPKAQAEDTEY